MRRQRYNYDRPYLTLRGLLRADKVTLRDYRAARWQRAQDGGCGKHLTDLAYLMSAPVDAPRDKLRDQVPYSDKKLATLSRKFLSPRAPEFRPNSIPVDQWRTPRYADWLKAMSRPGAKSWEWTFDPRREARA